MLIERDTYTHLVETLKLMTYEQVKNLKVECDLETRRRDLQQARMTGAESGGPTLEEPAAGAKLSYPDLADGEVLITLDQINDQGVDYNSWLKLVKRAACQWGINFTDPKTTADDVRKAWVKHQTKFEGESSALAVSYYLCPVNNPHQAQAPYVAECSDIQEALGMTHAEGEIFAGLWRKCAERSLGRKKAGNTAVRDAEKIYHYSKRVLSVETGKKVL